MRHRLIISIFMILILELSVFSPKMYGATENIADLGTVAIMSEQDAVALFESMLAKQTQSAYKVVITNKSKNTIDFHNAMLLATETFKDSQYYFRPENFYSHSDQPSLFYVGKVDLVMKTAAEFDNFLLENNGKVPADTSIRLCDYTLNKNYPYSSKLGLGGEYEIKDKQAYGTSVIRTLHQFKFSTDVSSIVLNVSSEEALRNVLTQSVNKFQEKIVFSSPESISNQSVLDALSELDFKEPSPQFDFYKGAYVSTLNNVHTVQLYYRFTPSECRALLDRCMQIAADVVSKIITPEMDDYTKVKLLHDYIISNTAYDDFAYQFKLDDQRVYSFVGPLIDHLAVCEGYASAYRLLLNTAGIENYTVSGSGDTEANLKKDHAWNIVKLGDYYYHVDTTWDDKDNKNLQYYYFALSDSQMAKDHTWNRDKYPACLDDGLEYFKKNNLLIETQKGFTAFAQKQLMDKNTVFAFKFANISEAWLSSELSKLLQKLYPDGYEYRFLKYKDVIEYTILPKGSIMVPSAESKISALNLKDICFSGNTYFAVGEKGSLLSSKNGVKWQLQKPLTTQNLNGVALGKGIFISAGDKGAIFRSTDGANWKSVATGIAKDIRKVAFLGNRFWIVGTNGLIAYSTDGVRWTISKSNTTVALNDLIYAQNRYVAVGQSGTVLTSIEGTKWIKQATGTSNEFKSIAYGNGVYLTGGSSYNLFKSSDGIKWMSYKYNSVIDFNKIIYANNTFVAVGDSKRFTFDSKSLSMRYVLGRDKLKGIICSGDYYFIVGERGQLYKSEKGSVKVLVQVEIDL